MAASGSTGRGRTTYPFVRIGYAAMLTVRRSALALLCACLLPLGSPAAAPPAAAQAFPAAPNAGVDVPALVERLLPSVVNISTVRYETPADGAKNAPVARRRSLGSGFVIDPAGVILTNRHVIENADEITVTFGDGITLGATVIAAAAAMDIALLRVTPATELPAVRWGDSFTLRQGQPVIAIGNPFGYGGSVTMGIVSALDRDIKSSPYDHYVQTDASINPGSSGGPLFNLAGEVIGVNTQIATTSATAGSVGIGFAIPSNDVQFAVNRLLQFGRIRVGWLAVKVQKTSAALAEAVGMEAARGVIVTRVDTARPGLAEAIWPGDVILNVDGIEVHDVRTFNRALGEQLVGSVAPLLVWRDGRQLVVDVPIDDNPQDMRSDLGKPPRQPQTVSDGRDLGLNLTNLDEEARTRLKLAEGQTGLAVVHVEPLSLAADQGLLAGEAILMVHHEPVRSVRDFWAHLDRARGAGKGRVLLLIRNADGDERWVAIPTT